MEIIMILTFLSQKKLRQPNHGDRQKNPGQGIVPDILSPELKAWCRIRPAQGILHFCQ